MKIIAANFKMNMTFMETQDYITKIKKYDNKNIIFFPTSIYASYFLNSFGNVGIQNCYLENTGAYTGEISPYQAKSMGINYVIIGHSERRKYFNETNDILNKKIKKSLENDLKVIYCIGETLEERENNITNDVLTEQIKEGLNDIDEEVIIAYEPVWAIGTNITPTSDQIYETVSHIKKLVKGNVLYGGSITDDNIEILNNISNVDGFLIGGASLNTQKMEKIIKVVS